MVWDDTPGPLVCR